MDDDDRTTRENGSDPLSSKRPRQENEFDSPDEDANQGPLEMTEERAQ